VPGSKTGSMRGMSSGINAITTWAKYIGYGALVLIILIVGIKIYKKRKNKIEIKTIKINNK